MNCKDACKKSAHGSKGEQTRQQITTGAWVTLKHIISFHP